MLLGFLFQSVSKLPVRHQFHFHLPVNFHPFGNAKRDPIKVE